MAGLSGDGIARRDLDAEAFCRMVGYTCDELAAMTLAEVCPHRVAAGDGEAPTSCGIAA